MTLTRERARARIRGRLVAMALVVAACWAVLLSLASPVSGAAPVLRSTSPGIDSTIRPDDLVLTFDRPVNAGLATVRMTDPYHREIDPGRPVHFAGRAETVAVAVPKVKYAGTYTVAWSVPTDSLAAASGTLTFDLASRSPVQEAPKLPTGPGVVLTVVYWVVAAGALGGLALLAGAVFFVAFVRPADAGSARVRRLVTYGWLGAFACTLGSFLLYGPYAARLPVTDALQGPLLSGTFASATGANLLARLAILALTGLVLAQFLTCDEPRNDRERFARGVTVLGCAAALGVTWTLSTPRVLDLRVVVAAHAAAVLLAGALAFLLRRKDFAVVGAVMGVFLVAATAFLVIVSPPQDRLPQAAPARLAYGAAGQDGYGLLDVAVAPAKLGENTVHLTVLDARDVPVDAAAVTAVLNPPDNGAPVPVSLHRAGTGYLTGSADIPRPGQWELALTVDSGGQHQDIYGVVDVRDAR